MDQTDAKNINIALADTLKEALEYRRLSVTLAKSPRQRAIYKALADSSAIRYNNLVRTIGYLATSKQGKLGDLLYPTRLFGLTEHEIEEIVLKYYGANTKELNELNSIRARELTAAGAVEGQYPSRVQNAIKELAEAGLLGKFLNLDGLMSADISTLPTLKAAPRGNASKGGIVKSLLAKGYSLEKANLIADQRIADTENLNHSSRHDPHFDRAELLDKTISRLPRPEPLANGLAGTMTLEEAIAAVGTNSKSDPDTKLMDLLTGNEPEFNNDADFDSEEV